MEIYLVRHTKPLIEKGVCYGQTDIPVDAGVFEASARQVLEELPEKTDALYSSPLTRCSCLADYIRENKYRGMSIEHSSLLKELHFGDWENKKWDAINHVDLQKWMNDFVNLSPHGGESYVALHHRTRQFLQLLKERNFGCVVLVTHAGVIRSIQSHIRHILLKDTFELNCDYGKVVKLIQNVEGREFNIT